MTSRACRIRGCDAYVNPWMDAVGGWLRVCPSCRLAGRYGAALATVVVVVCELLMWWIRR